MYIKYFGETKHYCQMVEECEICSLSIVGLKETVDAFKAIYGGVER